MRINKSNQAIGRVKCCVNSCEYYGDGDHCLASEIEIQPPNATNTETTDCATFAPKQ